jgi:hypothetical protein
VTAVDFRRAARFVRPAGAGVPVDAGAVRKKLEDEGVRFDGRGRAAARQRFRPRDWR